MISSFTDFHARVWADIEERLTPFPAGSKESKFLHVLPLIAEIPLGLALSCLQVINKILAYLASFSPWPRLPHPKDHFSSVLKDARLWEKLGDVESQITLGHGNPNFLCGTSTCTYQDSGDKHCRKSQWRKWAEKILPKENRSGSSANLFEMYQTEEGCKKVIDALEQLHVNSYRFSIEWSQIEPKKGQWNEAALAIYVNFCKRLRDRGITPVITLHHFSEPNWFHEDGSFENEQNIDSFIRFAERVVPELTKSYKGKPLVEHFCTINEPAVEAFCRFVRGAFSPGIVMNFKRAATFLKGALKAHALVYERLKKITPQSVKIGIVHQYLNMIPMNPLLFPVTHYLNRLMNQTVFKFFQTGKFEFKMPFVNVTEESNLKPKTDFVGVQYYARPKLGLFGSTSDHAPMTQMPFLEDPEGLYEAIIECHKAFKAPVMVTENGISTYDDAQRARYMTRALYAAQRSAKEIGEENLLGYFKWSFTDNFEWDMGMKPQAFGAFTQDLKLKEGAKAYARINRAWRTTVAD